MAENKGFDLSALIAGVSYQDTGRQQIEYIPLDLIDPDPENFYSLDGLDELAGSIELLGLQQPLLLRPGQDGRYTLTSGHRRRAAIMMIRDGGSEQFAEGVPCIVDRSEASAALQKLKLLMANKDTRKMSSADENKQAEELENVLRELEDAGYTFPGRLRDWVSKLSGMSRSKLARLKVIREKLDPEIKKEYYNTGKLNESTAYELAQLPRSDQRDLVSMRQAGGRDIKWFYASDVTEYVKRKEKLEAMKCPMEKGEGCVNCKGILSKIERGGGSYVPCRSQSICCANCDSYLNCKDRCGRVIEKAIAEKERRKAETAETRAKQKAKDDKDKYIIEHVWARYGEALRRAGLTDKALRAKLEKDQRTWGEYKCYINEHVVKALLDFENADITPSTALPYGSDYKVWDFDRICKFADALGCSLDYLFLRSDDPEGGAAPGLEKQGENEDDVYMHFSWKIGQPPQNVPGWYAVRAKIIGELIVRKTLFWDGDQWYLNDRPNRRQIDSEVEILAWFPLPEDDESEEM